MAAEINLNYQPLKTAQPKKSVIPKNGKEPFYYTKIKNLKYFYDFFSKFVYKNEALMNAPEGVYTWVLLMNGDLYAIPTITNQETGTLHKNLLLYIKYIKDHPNPTSMLMISGELIVRINDGSSLPNSLRTIEYNFESGIFNDTILKKKKLLQQRYGMTNTKKIQEEILVPVMNARLEEVCGCTPIPRLGRSFFENISIETNTNLIEQLNQFIERGPLPSNTVAASAAASDAASTLFNLPPHSIPLADGLNPSSSRKAPRSRTLNTQRNHPYARPNSKKGGKKLKTKKKKQRK